MKEQASGLSLVMTTAPDEATAARLARGLVQAQLAACVQVVPGVRSFYVWEGEPMDEAEWLLLAKTAPEKLPDLEAWLEQNHPYDLPEYVTLRAEGSAGYAAWVEKAVRPG